MKSRVLAGVRAFVRLILKLVVALFVGVYLLIIRSFLVALAIYICLYFASGTAAVRHLATELVSGEIPGFVTAANVQWGPLPWSVRIADGAVWGELAQPLIRVPAAEAEIDLAQTAQGIARMIVLEDAPITFVLERARAVDPFIHVTVDDDGLVDIERAFSIPEVEDGDPSPIHDIRITHGQVVNASGRVDIPLFSLEIEGVDAVGDFNYQGEKDPYFLVHRAHVDRADLHLRPVHRPFHEARRFSVPLEDLDVVRFDFRKDRFDVLRASGGVDGGTTTFRLSMLLQTREPEWRGDGVVSLPATSGLLPDLVDDHLSGPVRARVSGRGTISEALVEVMASSPRMMIAGLPFEDVTTEFGIEPRITPGGRLSHRFMVDRAFGTLLGGRVTASPAVFQHRWAELDGDPPAWPTRNHLETTVLLEGVDPCQLLPRVEDGPDIPATCAFSGTVVAAGSIEEFSDFLVIRAQSESLTLDWSGMSGVPLDEQLRVDGGVRYISGPPGALPMVGDRFEAIERLVLDDVRFDSGDDRLRFDGLLDLARGTITGTGAARLPNLAGVLAPLGISGFGGDVQLKSLRVGGTLLDPAIRGDVHVTNGVFAGTNVGTVDGRVELANGLVRASEVIADTPFGTITGDGEIRLHHGDITDLSGAHPFEATDVSVRNLQLAEFVPQAGVVGELSIDADSIEGDANDPMGTLAGEANVRIVRAAFGGERAHSVTAYVDATTKRVTLTNIDITLESGDHLKGTFAIDPQSLEFGGSVNATGLPFSSVRFFTENDLPLVGRVDLDLTLGGSVEAPTLDGEIGVAGFAVGPVQLGSARLGVTTNDEGHFEVAAVEDFPGFDLRPGTLVEMTEGLPTHAVILAHAHDVEVFDVLPPLTLEDTRVVASGMIDVELWPFEEGKTWEVRVDSEPDQIRIELLGGEVVYHNLSPTFLVQRPDELMIAPTALGRDLVDVLTVCGRIDGEQRLDLRLTGRANLELAGSLDDLFSVLAGAIAIGPDPETARSLGDDRCLPLDDAVLRLQGPVDALQARGRLEARDVRIIPRGFGREFRIDDTAGVLVRPGDAPNRLRLELEESRKFRGELEDGAFSLWGHIILEDLYPDDAELYLTGRDLFYSDPGEFNMTVTPDVKLVMTDFDIDETRDLRLTGEALVTEGLYFLRLDNLSAAFDAAGGGSTHIGSSVPLTERVPWLKDLTFDLDVTSSLFAVRPQLTMGKGELETRFALKMKGNLDAPEFFDRLEIIPGGTFEYDPIEREFEVARGTLDFSGDPKNPYVDLEADTEISYLTLVGDEQDPQEREVTVSVRIFGPLDQIQVEFFSKTDPSFDTADLQSLILTGRPRDEGGQVQDTLGVSYDFGDLLTNIIKAPLFEALNVRVGSDLTVSTDVRSRLGRAMELRTRVVQDPSETRVSAGFDFKFSDILSLEGRLQRTERSQNPTQTYEARLKLRIPLD